ncbi:unnamed protein product [Notodromas monacha]|uniref:Uncharacterized protein n=1 Tax=Notodromas monacha TaxID=399045 RepID=A0A7R9GCK2_9CRUS|nr:unnamed protein product [Notodromas monacha]CAG0915932.1 unnamed protein product [Notodromas monacha]
MDRLGEAFGNFRLRYRGEIDGRLPVVIYKSEASGLTIVLHKVPGPIVNGYVALGTMNSPPTSTLYQITFIETTEPLDDDGLPHTLEHLVFMGSDEYPWKGMLDLVANRCFASGTNAWTAQDHTAYTMKTAGSGGFCNLLPIYLDHIFFPTLQDSSYLTEIHHINGIGDDGGIVYSEMQSIENTAGTMVHHAMKTHMYPGKTGYNVCSGGSLKNLRESCNNVKVKAFHRAFYRPENVWLIVTGHVTAVEVMDAIEPIERKLVKKVNDPFVRPWSSNVEDLKKTSDVKVLFPANEEDFGMVEVGWRGPFIKKGVDEIFGLSLLMDYMVDTAISPLRKAFVEMDCPLASRVGTDILDNAASSLIFMFHNVPISKLDLIAPKLMECLKSVKSSTFDMKRMSNILHRTKIDFMLLLESNPSLLLASETIGHMLYGTHINQFRDRLNRMDTIEQLMGKSKKFWVALLRKYFDPALPHVIVRGCPSIAMKQENASKEASRLNAQKQKLGKAGMELKEKLLTKAVKANEVAPDQEILESIPVPSVKGIRFHPITSYANFNMDAGRIESLAPNFDLGLIPFKMRIDDVNSSFIAMSLIINTSEISDDLRSYLPLYLKCVKETGLKLPSKVSWLRDDDAPKQPCLEQCPSGQPLAGASMDVICDSFRIVPHETVVTQLNIDTQVASAGLGIESKNAFSPGAFSQYAVFNVQVEMEKYVEGVQWLRNLVFYPHLEPSRVQIVASKLAQSVAQKRKEGRGVALALIKDLNYSRKSNVWVSGMIRQQRLLLEISDSFTKTRDAPLTKSKRLDSPVNEQSLEASAAHLLKLKELQKALINSASSMVIHMATDLCKLKSLRKTGLEDAWLETFAVASLNVPNKAEAEERIPSSGARLSVHEAKHDWLPAPDRLQIQPKSEPALRLDQSVAQFSKEDLLGRPDVVLGMGSVESAYLYQTVKTDILSYYHESYAPMLVFLQYFKQLEGPIWKAVRGKGLAYSYNFNLGVDEGLMHLSLGMASNILDAYAETEKIFRSHLDGKEKWNNLLFESAKSSLIYDLVERESSISSVVTQSLLAAFQSRAVDFFRNFLTDVNEVKLESMIAAGKSHMLALFDPEKSRCAIVCNPDKVSHIVGTFRKHYGRELRPFSSIEETPLSSSFA